MPISAKLAGFDAMIAAYAAAYQAGKIAPILESFPRESLIALYIIVEAELERRSVKDADVRASLLIVRATQDVLTTSSRKNSIKPRKKQQDMVTSVLVKEGQVILGAWNIVAGSWYFTQKEGKPLSGAQLSYCLQMMPKLSGAQLSYGL